MHPGLFLRPQGFVQGAMGWWARWKPMELRRARGPCLRDSRKASQDPSSLPSHQPRIREHGWEEYGQQLGLNVCLLPVSRWVALGKLFKSQNLNNIFKKDLFIHETERERGRDTGRGRSRLHAGSPMWDSIPGSRGHALGQRRCQTAEPPGVPSITFFFLTDIAMSTAQSHVCSVSSAGHTPGAHQGLVLIWF